MAIDDWLLDEVVAGRSGPVLRLYRWARPTLSLGWHQRSLEPHWCSLGAQRGIDLVRRPSGGRAVLHAGCLTYALLWPDPPAGERSSLYQQACGWLRAAFAELGLPLRFGTAAVSHQRSSCFATSTAADLVHADGAKRIGSAQLWRRAQLLQHGSLMLEPPGDLWQEVFGQAPPDLPPLPLELEALESLLRRAAADHLAGGPLVERPLAEAEWALIEARRGRYRVAGPSLP
jgi:lipoate-protein ligase A